MVDSKNQNFKIALYIRVSTEEQAENPEGSIRNQEDRLRDAITYKNRSGTFGEIRGVYTDAGISAKDMRRPKLQELLRAIRNGEVNLVMVTELSRLSRNTRDFIQMWDMMRAHGCRFQSLREDFDTTNAAGELVLFQLMNLAQFERRQTSERVEANIAARAARGLYNGGMVPLGYRLIPEKPGYLAIDTEMAATVQTAFATFIQKGSLSVAAKWLNDNGYVVRRNTEGGSYGRNGTFTVDSLQALLRNKAYLGIKVFTVRGETKEAKAVWPAIVEHAAFVKVGRMLDRNRHRLKPWKKGRLPYILSGIVHCQNCASHMPGKSATGNGGKTGYYEHAWATKRDSTLTKKMFKCEPHRVPSKKLEPLVWEKLNSALADPSFMRDIFERARKHHQANPLRKEQERLRAKISGLASQLEGLAERLTELPKEVSATPIFKQMQRLEGLKADHESALVAVAQEGGSSVQRIADLESFKDFARTYKKLLRDDATVPEKKQAVQKFIRKIEVGVDSVRISFIIDRDHFNEDPAHKPGSIGPGRPIFLKHVGSNTLTFGARKRT